MVDLKVCCSKDGGGGVQGEVKVYEEEEVDIEEEDGRHMRRRMELYEEEANEEEDLYEEMEVLRRWRYE